MKVHALHAGNPNHMTGAGNCTYLVGDESPVLIDAGVGEADHVNALAEAVPAGPRQVLVTHAHPDHAAGAETLAARWPRMRLAKYPWPEKDAAYRVAWQPLTDGETIDLPGGQLEVIHTPGHSPDHVALWDKASATVFTGDLVVLGSSVVILASSGGDLRDYLASLRRVLALEPKRLLPAHGPAVDDPAALIHQYLEHRQQREQQVLEALHDGHHTIDAMVAQIYRGLAVDLVPMARESVLAHLMKLERDGEIGRAADGADSWMVQAGRR